MLCSMKWSSATLLLPSATLMNATALHPAYSSHALRDSRQLQARTAGNTANTRMQIPNAQCSRANLHAPCQEMILQSMLHAGCCCCLQHSG